MDSDSKGVVHRIKAAWGEVEKKKDSVTGSRMLKFRRISIGEKGKSGRHQ